MISQFNGWDCSMNPATFTGIAMCCNQFLPTVGTDLGLEYQKLSIRTNGFTAQQFLRCTAVSSPGAALILVLRTFDS